MQGGDQDITQGGEIIILREPEVPNQPPPLKEPKHSKSYEKGPVFVSYLESIKIANDKHESENLYNFTSDYLSKNSDPDIISEEETGIIIGKVQSGKTRSILALSALAIDNNYKLVIILTGTKTLLLQQFRARVNYALSGNLQCKILNFDKATDTSVLRSSLKAIFRPNSNKGLVITILKHHSHIDALAKMLETSELKVDLRKTRALIIDDEADEASLDNRAAKKRKEGRTGPGTTTYESIRYLRSCLPNNLFTGYTATPHANLLTGYHDKLSPKVYKLLEPGDGYCSIDAFFEEDKDSKLACIIPLENIEYIESTYEGDPANAIPTSLQDAMLCFYVGAALNDIQEENLDLKNQARGMLVHPHKSIEVQFCAEFWVKRYHALLQDELSENAEKKAFRGTTGQKIRQAISELSKTVNYTDYSEEILIEKMLSRVENTEFYLINSKSKSSYADIKFDQGKCNIIIGGDTLQRGFTIEGLTVTWMPRSLGVRQIDILMQRARWLGYRSDYLKYCRVYLAEKALETYKKLAGHESTLWNHLKYHGDDMTTLIRTFDLRSPDLEPSRKSARAIQLSRQTETWDRNGIPNPLPELSDQNTLNKLKENAKAVQKLLDEVDKWLEFKYHEKASQSQIHRYAELALVRLLDLLGRWNTFSQGDKRMINFLKSTANQLLNNNQITTFLFVEMRYQAVNFERTLVPDREDRLRVENLFQGYNPYEADYPGDKQVRSGEKGIEGNLDESLITLQLHRPKRLIMPQNDTGLLEDEAELSFPEKLPFLTFYIPSNGYVVSEKPR